MFYLNVFLQSLYKNKVRAIIYLALCFMITFLSIYKSSILDLMKKNLSHLQEEVSFQVAVDDSFSNKEKIEKSESLPGVTSVIKLSSAEVVSRLGEISDQYDVNLGNVLNEVSIYKISLNPGISIRNQNLVRKYFEKLLNNSESIISPLDFPSAALSEQTSIFINTIENIFKVILFVLFLSFFVSHYFLTLEIFKQSYIIENFQRKKKVGLKATTSGSAIFLALIGMSFLINYSKGYIFLTFLIIFFITLYIIQSQRMIKN